MAIGGFNGTDPSPTLASSRRGSRKARSTTSSPAATAAVPRAAGTTTSVSSQITTWVESHYTAKTVGGVTVYDLTAATTS